MKRAGMRAAILGLAMLAMPLTGCEAVKSAIGYPTDAEIAAVNDRATEAEAARDEARAQVESLESARALAVTESERAEERRTELRTIYAAQADQLGRLDGPAADAMRDAMRRTDELLMGEDAAAADWADVIARHDVSLGMLGPELKRAEDAVDRMNDELDGLVDRADASLAGVFGLITEAGAAAQDLGVPAAESTASRIVAGGSTLFATLLGVGGVREVRRRRSVERERDAAALEAGMIDKERARLATERDHLAEVVAINDKVGLIPSDEGISAEDAKSARAAARDLLSSEAWKTLKRVEAEAAVG